MIKSRTWRVVLVAVIIIPIITGLISQADSLILYLGNTYFYFCAPFLIIGLFAKILSAGTFDTFHYSVKKARPKRFKNEIEDEPELHALSASIGPWYQNYLTIGTILLVLAIIFSAIYLLTNN